MQAPYTQAKARLAVTTATLALLLNSALAQVANPNSTPQTANGTTTTTTTTTSTSEQPVVLSPFEVESTQDTGYRPRNTLAGSRISTPLNELAEPITVVTKDFIDDIGATDVNDILTYEVGTEGTNEFQSNTPQLGRTSDNVAQNPNTATRGRGLAPFDVTRDYFYSLTAPTADSPGASTQSVGFDTYNLDNVTIVRGADSILAGLGSPAGIINYAPQVAVFNRNSGEISYRFGSFNDQRATLNANIVAIPDMLAFRVAGLWADKGYEQQPAYDHDKRYFIAVGYKPFKWTTIRASYESVFVNARFPNTYTPEDDITQWIQLGKPSAQFGVTPTGPGSQYLIAGGALNSPNDNVWINSNYSFFSAFNGAGGYSFYQQNLSNVGIWQPLRFSNNEYGDWQKLNTNDTLQQNRQTSDEISIDQQVFPHFSVNVSMLHEIANALSLANLGRPDYVADQIDVMTDLPWGAPNPNFGDTFMGYGGLDNRNGTYSTNLVVRATATYDLDLKQYNKWLGRYVFTGFVEDRRTTTDFNDYNAGIAGMPTQTGNGPGIYTYTGGTAANNYYQTVTPIEPFLFNSVPLTGTNGVTTDSLSTVDQLKEEQKSITKLTTSAFVAQAYLLDDEVSGIFGIRRDKNEAGFLNSNNVINGIIPALPNDQFSEGPLASVQAQTKTYGVVIHGPKIGRVDLSWLSVAYDQSQNFIPNAGSVDLLGNPTPDPTGTTKDYSIMVDLFGGRLNAKIDWFTSLANNGAATTVNFPLVQWTMPFENLENNGENGRGSYYDLAVQAGHGADYTSGIDNNLTTGDPALANAYTDNNVSKGMEFELTYNITRNWRLFATVTREQAFESNIAPALTTLINSRVAYWQSIGIWNGPLTTRQDWSGEPETGQVVYDTWVLPYVVAYESAEGQPAQQLHKWKGSLVTNYTMDKGIVKGLGFGTGIRYLDKTIIGNPAIYTPVNGVPTVSGLDLANPYTAPAQVSVEAWISYQRKVYKDYVVAFRLQGDNLETSGGYTPVNANSDGTHQLFTITQPRTYYFTTEIRY
jgi:hypothetical protein